MKKVIIGICFLLISMSANAAINRLPSGLTYCVSEYGGDFVINWKNNTIDFKSFGSSDTYKIIKEAKDSKKPGIALTARLNFYGNGYTEFKVFSNQSGDFLRVWDRNTEEYSYQPAKLSCWNEE